MFFLSIQCNISRMSWYPGAAVSGQTSKYFRGFNFFMEQQSQESIFIFMVPELYPKASERSRLSVFNRLAILKWPLRKRSKNSRLHKIPHRKVCTIPIKQIWEGQVWGLLGNTMKWLYSLFNRHIFNTYVCYLARKSEKLKFYQSFR